MIWQDIEGYLGIYQVSDTGLVRSKYIKGGCGDLSEDHKILKFSCTKSGYRIVHLYKDHKRKTHQIHTLVADAFLPKIDGKKIVNHIDGVKHNNDLKNLERCTASENSKHAYVNGLTPKPPTKRKLADEDVRFIFAHRLRNDNRTLARRFSVDTSVICRIKNGKSYGWLTNKYAINPEL